MKGLLLNNLYSMKSNIILSFMIAIAVAFIPMLTGQSSMILMIISMQIFIFPLNIGSSLQTDEVSKWNKLEITLPVKRSSIIKAKYISFMILILIGMLISTLTLILFSLTGIENNLNIFWSYSYGLSLAILMVSMFYPAILKFGAEKSEMFIIVSAGLSLILQVAIWFLLISIMDNVNFKGLELSLPSLAFAILFLATSYIVSLKIQYKKEF